RISLVDQEAVGDQKARERGPRVDRVAPVATNTFDIVAVENLEAQAEACIEFVLPLAKHGWRAGNHDISDAAAEEQFGGDETGLNGLTETHVIGDEEVNPG